MKQLIKQIRIQKGILPTILVVAFLGVSLVILLMTNLSIFSSWQKPTEVNQLSNVSDYQYSEISSDKVVDYFVAYQAGVIDKIFVFVPVEEQLVLMELDGSYLEKIQKHVLDGYFDHEFVTENLISEKGAFIPMEQELKDLLVDYFPEGKQQQVYHSVFRADYIGDYSFERLADLRTIFFIAIGGLILSLLYWFLAFRKHPMIRELPSQAFKDTKNIFTTKKIYFSEEGFFFIQKKKVKWLPYKDIHEYYYQSKNLIIHTKENVTYVIQGTYSKKEQITKYFDEFCLDNSSASLL